MTEIVLVNELDEVVGTMEKMEAHQKGLLHRAFSVFILNSKKEVLLQQRALNKYHSGGLWTNTCCSHPFPGEELHHAASRRLKEEMGLTCELHHIFHFIYRAQLDGGLIEHELDHVFIGTTDDVPVLNPEEVNDFAYVNLSELQAQVATTPNRFTAWFNIIFSRFQEYVSSQIIANQKIGNNT